MRAIIGLVLSSAFLVGCGTQETVSGTREIWSFEEGVPATFADDVKAYKITNYKVKGGDIKSLIKASDIMAIQIKEISLIPNRSDAVSYAQGAAAFGKISEYLLEFIDNNVGYGEDGDMRCGDVQESFDARMAVLLAKLHQELSQQEGSASSSDKYFWETGFYIARAWKKFTCGDKYQAVHWESKNSTAAQRDDSKYIVPRGSSASDSEKKNLSDSSNNSSKNDEKSNSADKSNGGNKSDNSYSSSIEPRVWNAP